MTDNTACADLIIIGAGGSGLAAAVSALEQGLRRVILIEKRASTGGNAVFANGIFACDSRVQRAKMVDMPADTVYKKALEWHRYTHVNPRILRRYINQTARTVDWLLAKGVEFDLNIENRMTFDQEPSWHVVAGKGELARFGYVTKLLQAEFKDKGGELLLRTETQEILKDSSGAIRGVRVKTGTQVREIAAPRVLLCTGGFVGNKELLAKYVPTYDDTFDGFFVAMMGDGVALAAQAGGFLEDHATLIRENCFSSPKPKNAYLTVASREPNVIWVNRKGRRFVDETCGFDLQPSVNVLYTQPGKVGFALYTDALVQEVMDQGWKLPRAPATDDYKTFRERLLESAREGEWVSKSDTLEGTAKFIGCDAEVLAHTVQEFNEHVSRGYDADFVKERRFLTPLTSGPYYVIRFRTMIIETCGPVRVDECMRVLDANYDPIPGFYASGALTAGWLSTDYCGKYLFGTALAYALASGRIAAETAAAQPANP